ncbi:ribonuclease domain-containing protein [Uliginosibacterium sp. 31-16]|uniref:ribonuclease domain-containing protein n=1 Tax=Uliginosibacterium sp. 31-16 TaxID=3068315 RepID=UPI003531AA8D
MAEARSFWSSQDELPSVSLHSLPPEARATLALIQRGGPFPYQRDGVVFQNRERRLPRQARGYYREYTVPTPGAQDRGARRIIAGEAHEYYYTANHYRSFQRIQP